MRDEAQAVPCSMGVAILAVLWSFTLQCDGLARKEGEQCKLLIDVKEFSFSFFLQTNNYLRFYGDRLFPSVKGIASPFCSRLSLYIYRRCDITVLIETEAPAL